MPNSFGPEIGRCPNCSNPIGERYPYAWCSECGNPLPEELKGALGRGMPAPPPEPTGPRVRFEVFRSSVSTWGELMGEAAEFASRVGREKLISISHSEDNNDGVVTVWYWE